MAKKKILEDHKKVGKIMLPPFLSHDMPIQETKYTEELLPEIIWMGLIHEELGFKKGIDLIRTFIQLASDSKESEGYINFSISSHLYKLSEEEIKILIDKLIDKNIFFEVSDILSPLTYFYKDSPFSFLNKEIDLTKEDELVLLEKLKTSLTNNFDKFQQASNVAQFNVFYTRVIDEKISFYSGMKVPNFDSIINNFDSDESMEASAFVRNNVKSEFMYMSDIEKHTFEWSKSFWNQSHKLDNCEFKGYYND